MYIIGWVKSSVALGRGVCFLLVLISSFLGSTLVEVDEDELLDGGWVLEATNWANNSAVFAGVTWKMNLFLR